MRVPAAVCSVQALCDVRHVIQMPDGFTAWMRWAIPSCVWLLRCASRISGLAISTLNGAQIVSFSLLHLFRNARCRHCGRSDTCSWRNPSL